MKTLNAYLVLAAAAAAALGAASPASATIKMGDNLQIQYFEPDKNTVVETDTVTFAGPGTTLPFYYAYNTAAFDYNLITLTYGAFGYPSGSFVGIEISDLSNSQAFAGWTVQSGAAPTPFTESQSGGVISINWSGASGAVGDRLAIAPGPVPGAGLAGLAALALAGLHARKRRA
jgi:hypothetical protein